MPDYYVASSDPAEDAEIVSSVPRTENAAIAAGFAKVAGYTGNGGKIVAINAGGTAQEAITTTGTGSGVRATSPTLVTPALGTPASGTLTNCTGLPVAGTTGYGTGVATWLATPSSANLAAAVTGETGSGGLVFATSPTLVTPALGTPTSGVLTNCTFPTLNQNTSGTAAGLSVTLAVGSGGTGATSLAGAGILVSGGALGTPSSGTLTNCSFPTLNQNTSGTAANITAYTINQSVGTANSPSFVDVTITSDETLKMNWLGFDGGLLDRLAKVKRGIYDRKDVKVRQVGVSAQSLKKAVPEMVTKKNGKYQISQSGTLALVLELAAEVKRLRELLK